MRKITSKEGYTFIRNGENVGGTVYLGKYDSPDNYKEVSIEEWERMQEKEEETRNGED